MPVRCRRADACHARSIGEGESGRAFFRNQAKGCLQQRLFQIAVVIAALGAALFLAPAHVKGFYMSRAQRSLEHDPEKREPVFRKGHAQTKRWLTSCGSLHFGETSR